MALAPYKPIQVAPVGGLLKSYVGTPRSPLPPLTLDQFENDDMVTQLNRVTDPNSTLMRRAASTGMALANRRGLLNSTMAVEASQNAVLDKAIPIASQNSQQMAARNAQRIDFQGQTGLQTNQLASQERIATAGNQSSERIAQAQIASEEARLGRQLTAQEQSQIRDIAAQKELQGGELASRSALQSQQLASEEARLGRQLTAQEQAQLRDIGSQQTMQERDLASRSGLLGQQLTSQEALTREGYATDLAKASLDVAGAKERALIGETGANTRANLSAATTIQQQYMSNLSDAQKTTLAYYLDANKTYSNSLDSLWANKDIPAPARDDAIQSFLALRNSQVDLPKAVFGTTLNWGAPAAPATGLIGSTPTPTAAPAASPSYQAPQIASDGTLIMPPPPVVAPEPAALPVTQLPQVAVNEPPAYIPPAVPAAPAATPFPPALIDEWRAAGLLGQKQLSYQ